MKFGLAATKTGNLLMTDKITANAEHVPPELIKAIRNEVLEEAARVCPNAVRNYGMMKPGKPDQYASREAQIVAKGFARLIEEDIRALKE